MSNWHSSKALRDEYQTRILVSSDMRQVGRDGQTRSPSEKPPLTVEAPCPEKLVVPIAT